MGDHPLREFVNKRVNVITNDGKHLVGVLRGFDKATNCILEDSEERVYSMSEGIRTVDLGFNIVRGDNIAVVGNVDDEVNATIDPTTIRAEQMKPIVH